jgi:hypothetical protein
MGTYSTGSVKVIVGSQSVTGNGTRFDSYIADNDKFRLVESPIYYDIADVVSSALLTLSGRYADSTHETKRTSEHLATTVIATKIYSGTTVYSPVIINSFTIVASDVKWKDNGAGVLATIAGAGGGIAGTLNYDSGSWAVSVNATLNRVGVNINATYNSGNTLNSMPYQILTDYTTYYGLPEAVESDRGLANIFTKAMRTIDAKLYQASMLCASIRRLKVASYIRTGSHQYVFFGAKPNAASVAALATSVDASVKGSLYMANTGNLWILTSDTVATKIK